MELEPRRIKVIKRPDSEALRRQEISLLTILIRRHPEKAGELLAEIKAAGGVKTV